MEVKLYYDPHSRLFFVKCPLCESLPSKLDFTCDEYLRRPTLWCGKCEFQIFFNASVDDIKKVNDDYRGTKENTRIIKVSKKNYNNDNSETEIAVLEFQYDLLCFQRKGILIYQDI